MDLRGFARSADPTMKMFSRLAAQPLTGRFVALIAACALTPVALVAIQQGREATSFAYQNTTHELELRARGLAAILAGRVAAADALAATLTDGTANRSIDDLRAAAAASGIFRRALVGDGSADYSPLALLASAAPGAPAASAGGERGGSIVTISARGDLGAIYLVRPTRVAGRRMNAYFELSPAWLREDIDPQLLAQALVVDGRGTPLLPVAREIAHATAVVAARAQSQTRTPADITLAWQAQGSEWRGIMVPLAFASAAGPRLDVPWRVAAIAAPPAAWAALEGIAVATSLAVLLGLALAAALGLHLAQRLRWPLVELRGAVLRMGRPQFTPLPLPLAPPELAEITAAVNDVGARLQEDVAALETLGEIDHLLLGAVELEPVLDAILARVTTVTRCQCVGIALLDADSPTHGRVFAASDDAQPLPVSRVEFDPDLIESLADAGEGVTIARCEDLRHSFLAPLRALGSEFFWVWPVLTADRVVAVLAVGFREAPAPDPRFARHGAEFAARLAVALSKTARDEHLYRQAHYDPLTALPNRLLFRDRLTQEIAACTESRTRGALLYIDLDHFKKVNDSVGHAAGDQLLTIVAQRLRSCVKEGDTVARLAGDEFTVILRHVTDTESASMVGERIIEALKAPVNLAGRDHYVQASIGIALFPDDGTVIDQLMRNADTAMYRAKDMGRGRAVFFDRKLMMSRFETTHSGLYRALRRREFSLFYQPQFSLADGSLVGLEALLRWQTPREGTRAPADFIPAAETSGLIVDIGAWVVDAACSQLAIWREQGIAPRRLAINVSVQQLKYAEFPRNVRRILEKYGVPPELIEIEVTESVFADEAAGAAMRQLAEYGLRLALDDFGTGYSSLNYLRQHPIKVVKIDRSFLEDVPLNPASATLAETIITMAHALGKEVVAEGVENHEQLQFLRERHCDYAQGFFLARPLPVGQIEDLLQSRMSAPPLEALRQAG
jgi:diguanylate cyclase (GGDEF)-like protein